MWTLGSAVFEGVKFILAIAAESPHALASAVCHAGLVGMRLPIERARPWWRQLAG
jgi:hypothetical protein